MQSHDAEFSTAPGHELARVHDDIKRVSVIRDVMKHRSEFMAQLESRTRAVERDIEAWCSQQIASVMKDPWHTPDFEPPRSLYDVEPPF